VSVEEVPVFNPDEDETLPRISERVECSNEEESYRSLAERQASREGCG